MTMSTWAMTLSPNHIPGGPTANIPLPALQTRFHQHFLRLKREWHKWSLALFTVKKVHSESCFSFHIYNTVINKPVAGLCKSSVFHGLIAWSIQRLSACLRTLFQPAQKHLWNITIAHEHSGLCFGLSLLEMKEIHRTGEKQMVARTSLLSSSWESSREHEL